MCIFIVTLIYSICRNELIRQFSSKFLLSRIRLTPCQIWVKKGEPFIIHVFPQEIEDFLTSHPKVSEAQVIGAYDEIYGEEVCAGIRLRDGEKMTKDEMRDYCRGKIAHFKIPRYIEFVDEYPKTASGKIQKFRLREQFESKGVIPKKQNHS